MGEFFSTHHIVYENGSLTSQGLGPGDVRDGDPDNTFEIGDATDFDAILGFAFNYEGTAMVDGAVWPVFSESGSPTTFWVLMDQAPVSAPAILTYSAGAIFLGACFAKGTGILTPTGEVGVEEIQIGDVLVAADGTGVPVKWVGHQTIMPMFGPAKRNEPVKITANAIAAGVPSRDLTVTADHGLIVDGLMINASALVNGHSIYFVPPSELATHFTVYHIETDHHDVIIANGAQAETFMDTAGRAAFDNYAEYLDIYGIERIIREMDNPRISSQRLVPDAIKARLGIPKDGDDLEMLFGA